VIKVKHLNLFCKDTYFVPNDFQLFFLPFFQFCVALWQFLQMGATEMAKSAAGITP